MHTIKLTLSYDGANYVGWQIQPNGVSIQGCVQEAVRQMTGEGNNLQGAGRTDAGVHAVAQVAHFETQSSIPPEGFVGGLNGILPPDIAVRGACAAAAGFNARRDARGKRYQYRLLIDRVRRPLREGRVWRLERALDAEAMQAAADALVGTHDYESFRAAGCGARDAVRTITRMAIEPERDELVITVEGNGFVRHMIRNIVGCLVEVGQGKRSPADVACIRDARARPMDMPCAPACGLYLMEVLYKDAVIP